MKLKRKRSFKQSTCFGLGVAGALSSLAAGVLMLLGQGQANMLQALGFILTGAMVLLLTATERGREALGRRVRLLVLFLLLLASFFRLPPLDLLEAPVVVLAAAMYRQKGDMPLLLVLAPLEALFVVVRMLVNTGFWAGPAWLPGAALVAVALARGAVLLRLCLRKAGQPDENESHTLR